MMRRRSLARTLAAAAVLAVGVLVGGSATAGSSASAPASLAASAKAAPVVGSITKLGGTRKLQLQAGGKGAKRQVKVGAALRLGDLLTLGKGVTATVKLTRPTSVAEGTVLVLIRSASGTTHRSKVSRSGRTTTIVITPAKAAKKR